MSTLLPQIPSGSPASGRMVKITQTATLGDVLHAAIAGSANWDAITVYACNNDVASRELTIEFGGVTVDDQIVVTLPSKEGMVLISPAQRLQGGLVVTAFADAANVINCYVEIDRMIIS